MVIGFAGFTAPVTAAARTARAVFDAANRQIFSIDAQGLVPAFTYDSAANVTKAAQHAAVCTPTTTPDAAAMVRAPKV